MPLTDLQSRILVALAAKAVQPDPGKLGDYVAIEGVRRGHWPSSPDIAGAMIDPEPTS